MPVFLKPDLMFVILKAFFIALAIQSHKSCFSTFLPLFSNV
jgi:hypothetical protein